MLRLYLLTTLSACFAALVGLVFWALLTLLYYATGWQGLAGTTSLQVAAMVMVAFAVHLVIVSRLYFSLRSKCMRALQVCTQKRPWVGLLALMGLSLWAARRTHPSRR